MPLIHKKMKNTIFGMMWALKKLHYRMHIMKAPDQSLTRLKPKIYCEKIVVIFADLNTYRPAGMLT